MRMDQRGRRRRSMLLFGSRLTVGLAVSLVLSLGGETALASRASVSVPNAPSLGSILATAGRAFSPVATAAQAVSSWFNSTFLTSQPVPAPGQTPAVPGEVPWKRTSTTRTIRNANGRYTMEAFTHPINYQDSGVWQPIDNTLVVSSKLGYDWTNKANAFEVHLKKDLDDKPLAVVVGDDTYTLTPQGLAKQQGAKTGAEASYPGVAASTDLSYLATESGVKETLTLHGPNSPTEFKFLFEGPTGTKVVPQSDGSLGVESSEGKRVFLFEEPWAQEHQLPGIVSPIDPSDRHVSMSVKEVQLPVGFELTLSIDADWLKTPGRRFPVIVDPTIVIQPGQAQARETYVLSNCLTGSCSGTVPGTYVLVGTDPSIKARTMLAFDTTAVPYHSPISSATLTATVNGCMYTCANAQTIEAHQFTADWTSWEVTWDYANANFGPTLTTAPKSANQSTGTMSWSGATLTSVVQSWVNAEAPNNGFLLKLANEALSQGGPAYNSSRFATASARPKLAITYTANATHGYPPAAPSSLPALQLDSTQYDSDMLLRSPTRSLLRTSDGVLAAIYVDGNSGAQIRTAAPPYGTWSAPVSSGSFGDAYMQLSNSTFWKTTSGLTGLALQRWTRNGTGTTWTKAAETVYDSSIVNVKSRSVVKTPGGRIWVAFTKIPTGQTQTRLALTRSDNDGDSFVLATNQTILPVDGSAQLVPLTGNNAGIFIVSSGTMTWRTSVDTWASAVTFPEDHGAQSTPNFQAVVDDQNRIHVVYRTNTDIRYRMRDASGVWSPAASSPGTLITSAGSDVSLSTDGSSLTLLYQDEGTVPGVFKRTWNGSWSTASKVYDPFVSGVDNEQVALPQRLGVGLIPYLFQQGTTLGCGGSCNLSLQFDYIDSVPPTGSVAYPGEGQIMVTTSETLQVSPSDDGGTQRVDFFVDRGGGLIGFLGTDSTPANGFTYVWNTKEVDGSSKRLWPNGAYRVFGVVWDNKGNRGETNRPLSYIQDQDLGVRPYRPSLSIPIGAGMGAQVNLWNGNLTLTHGLLSDPSVIGPLSITRTYNSLDTQNGTAGRGWSAGAELDADISFTRLVDHATDAEYPQNVVELIETDGTSHYYQLSSGGVYAPFVDDFSVLAKNSDATWSLTLADGGRYTFDASGSATEYRTAIHAVDEPSFSYVYSSGKLSSITDPVGRGITLTYDGNGRLWKVTSNQTTPARIWTFTYSTGGELTDVQDPVNGASTTHFDYDSTTKLMIRARTPAGVRTEFGYDASNRITEVRQLHTQGPTTLTYATKVVYVDVDTTKVIRPKGNIAPCSGDPTCSAKYTTTFNLDGRYRLSDIQITLPDGTTRTSSISWNDQNLMMSQTDFSGAASSYTYDRAGNLLTERDPLGNTVTHRYDEPYDGLQGSYYNNTTLTPPAVLRRLDTQLNQTWSGSPGSGVNADNFSARWTGYINVPTIGSYTLFTTADNASRLYLDGVQAIDNWTSPIQTERASSPVTLAQGLHPIVVEMSDTTGTASISLSWQGPGIAKQIIPASNLEPGFNLETSRLDELGRVTTYIFEDENPPNYTNDQDAFHGRLVERKETNVPVGGTAQTPRTTFTYNSFGQITAKTTSKGNTGASPDPAYTTTYTYYGASEVASDPCTSTSYPQLGLLKSMAQPGLATKVQVYDGAGTPVAGTDGKGTACFVFDGLGRQTSMKAPDRATPTTYSYDPDGRSTTITDPLQPATTNYTYDDLGRLLTAKDSMAAVGESPVTYTYDEHGNVASRTDKTGSYAYVVDELDRLVQLTDQALRVYTFAYDADGKLTQQNLPNGTRATLSYNAANRLTAYRNQTSTGSPLAEYVYTHNARGEKLTEDGPQGLWVYTYDDIGRLEQAHDPTTGRTRRYSFDLNSNRNEVRLNQGWSTTKGANSWGSDPLPKVGWNGDNASFAYTLKFPFPFRGTNYTQAFVSTNGFLTLGTSAGAATTVDLAATTLKAIAPYARDLNIPSTNPTKGIFVEEPLNDSFVRIRWKTNVAGGNTAANFEVILYPSGQIKFNYESLPGTGSARVGVTPGNQLDFVAIPDYDRKTMPSNAQTVTLTPAAESTQTTYTYNALDQLAGGTGLSGISHSNDGEQTAITGPSPRGSWVFGYDGRGLMKSAASGSNATTWTLDGEARVAKEVKGSSETRRRFAGQGDVPAWEEDASGNITAIYVTGPVGLLASYASGVPTFYMSSGHGDVVQTRSLAGALIESYSYDEYGNLTSAQKPTRYGYTGRWQRERFPDADLIRMGARMYDPLVGRFTSWDPLEGGSLNPYDYAGSDPCNNFDLDGRQSISGDSNEAESSCNKHVRRVASAFGFFGSDGPNLREKAYINAFRSLRYYIYLLNEGRKSAAAKALKAFNKSLTAAMVIATVYNIWCSRPVQKIKRSIIRRLAEGFANMFVRF